LPSQIVALDVVATVLPPEWLEVSVPDSNDANDVESDPDVVEEPVPEPCAPQPQMANEERTAAVAAAARAMRESVVFIVRPDLLERGARAGEPDGSSRRALAPRSRRGSKP
jgi:hypothetical protein